MSAPSRFLDEQARELVAQTGHRPGAGRGYAVALAEFLSGLGENFWRPVLPEYAQIFLRAYELARDAAAGESS